ncbi:SGNH hydrolase domain-containing protein [Nocardioides sp. DS6]|uniref:SGNH hydrolase domain-containing protein n=1 Tax=Nocardioides eburneus TaxID=3231482 RepID=A0ABV3T1L4_9ACTN
MTTVLLRPPVRTKERPPAQADPLLPHPPSEREKYAYLGPQHRWLLLVQAVSFTLIGYSVFRFATADIRFILFLVPVTLYAVTLAVSLLSGTRRRRVSRKGHLRTVAEWAPAYVPSVDVFLPTAGEGIDVLANTYRHVAALDWSGRLTVHVLDDGARDEVRQLAAAHGFVYHSRPDRGHFKKAGNLRYGFEHSDADLILVLDADFVPRTDMLRELVPYFDDPRIGIVQSPQYFDTRSPALGWLQRCAGATQELFYRFVQPSRDRSGAAICVGTCAVYRRAALQEVGGFAQIGHSEDVHTGVRLMRGGYGLRYLPVLVAKGLCPDTVGAFVNQQYRWCTGSMSLLADQSFHRERAITKRQKLCFWAGFLYYISTAVNAVVAPLPALAMLWIRPEWVEPGNSVWLLGAVMLWFLVLPTVMKGRWRFDVLRVQYLYSFCHLAAIVHILTGRTRGWVATGASSGGSTGSAGGGAVGGGSVGGGSASAATPLPVTVMRWTKAWILATQVLLWWGLARGIRAYGLDTFWAMVGFAALGSAIQLPILFARVPGLFAVRRPRLPHVKQLALGLLGARPEDLAPGKPEAPGPRRFRPDIQGLRAIAVLLVVLYHANVPHLTGGYVGVDVFFVISGFLITGQLMREQDETGRISLLRFYGGRIRRLLPSALIVIAATLVMSRLWGSIFHVRDVVHDAFWGVTYLINYHLAAQGVDYQHATDSPSPLQHLWSLAVEEQYYLLWPLALIVCMLLGRRYRRTLVLAVLLVGGGLSLYVSHRMTMSDPPAAYFDVQTRAWELALGALVALAATGLARIPKPVMIPAGWAGLALIVWSGLHFTDDTPFPGTAALVPTLGAAAVIAAGGPKVLGGVEALLGRKVLGGIGKVSYGWYLWHWPMVVLVPLAFDQELPWVNLVEISALALWFAVMMHWLVESPALRSRLHPRSWVFSGAAGSGAVAGVGIALVVSLPAFVGSGAPTSTFDLASANTGVVQAALGKGLMTTEAPRNLRPSIQQATQDQPASTKDGCHLDFLEVHQGPCIYGDPHGKHTLALYGDSHAQQWLPALDREGKLKHWRIMSLTKAACSVADWTVYSNVLGREYTECMTWRQQAVAKMVKAKPDLVVVSQSDAVAGNNSNTAWADATTRTMAMLRQRGLRAAYLMDTPMPKQDVPECLAGNLNNVGACNTTMSQARQFGDRWDEVHKALTQASITTIDPTRWLCTPKGCPAIVGNTLVYRDESHMTATFSAWLAPMTAPLFATRHPAEAQAG